MRALTVAAAAALLAGCSGDGGGDAPLRHLNLIAGDPLTSTMELVPRGEQFCGDENRFALTLRPGEELSTLVNLGTDGRLDLGGCVSRPIDGAEPGGGELRLWVEPVAGGDFVAAAVPVPPYSKRWRQQVELAGVSPGLVRLRLQAELPKGRELYLWDFSLAHRAPPPPRRPVPPPPQVLFISVDTLREDALSALRGPWKTPALDRFVADAQVFSSHYAAAPWTKPSHASLLTGQSPRIHGAGDVEAPINPGLPTLAQRFRRGGFLTAGLVFDCLWLNPRFGFSRGFDEYRSAHWTLPQMVDEAGEWMVAHRDRPFFYFFHTFEVHSDFRKLPYEAPGVRRGTVRKLFGLDGYGCREGRCASGLLRALFEGELEPLPQEPEVLRFLYGRGVAHLDEELGELFARLREAGLYDGMTIVFTSDHGEALLEHDVHGTLHGTWWQEVLRVPLVVKWPGGREAGQRHSGVTSALDLAPTLLKEYGLPAEGLPGQPLAERRPDRPAFTWAGWDAVVLGDLKGVFPLTEGRRWLFDLAADPGERQDLSRERPEELERLLRYLEARRELDRQIAAELETAAEQLGTEGFTGEEEKRLKALGY